MAQVTKAVNSALISRKRSLLDISSSKQQTASVQPRKIVRVVSALPARLTSLKNDKNAVSPQDFLFTAMSKLGVNPRIYPFDAVDGLFVRPTAEEIAAYSLDVIDAVRMSDIEKLKGFHKEGRPLKCSNQFGESILHLACRKGLLNVVEFLAGEAKVSLWVKDDFGRNVLHDACWACEPNFRLIDVIVENCPELLFISDARGHTPLRYVRREHWEKWIKYLTSKLPTLKPTRLESYLEGNKIVA